MSTIDILGFSVSNDGLQCAGDMACQAIAAKSEPSVVACAKCDEGACSGFDATVHCAPSTRALGSQRRGC